MRQAKRLQQINVPHYIQFPDEETMKQIVQVHFPDIKSRLLSVALKRFFEVRDMPGLKKKPSTSELLDWHVHLFERLAFLTRREG